MCIKAALAVSFYTLRPTEPLPQLHDPILFILAGTERNPDRSSTDRHSSELGSAGSAL